MIICKPENFARNNNKLHISPRGTILSNNILEKKQESMVVVLLL